MSHTRMETFNAKTKADLDSIVNQFLSMGAGGWTVLNAGRTEEASDGRVWWAILVREKE